MCGVIVDCSNPDNRDEAIKEASDVVRAGRIVVLPTDTVYGVGADAFDEVAVAMVLAAKHRDREMPPPVLVPSPRTVDGLATAVPMYAKILMRQFWPGPLTLVLRAQASLAWDLGETNGTVALRMPDDDIALALLSEVGPMAVTSANVTGRPAATTAAQAQEQLAGAVTTYLDGGPRTGGAASTIVDCTGEEPVVLRHGALPADRLREVLGETRLHDEPASPEEPAEDTSSTEPAEDTSSTEPAETQESHAAQVADPESPGEPLPGVLPVVSARLVGSVRPTSVRVPDAALRDLPPSR
ncbi:MAG: threonylcarbamoyl-AMP synthase [Actinobacteria bacterium]|nr:threonylcarbamoyl-AMP synthase [Actinomycetota bacterium]